MSQSIMETEHPGASAAPAARLPFTVFLCHHMPPAGEDTRTQDCHSTHTHNTTHTHTHTHTNTHTHTHTHTLETHYCHSSLRRGMFSENTTKGHLDQQNKCQGGYSETV